ncbi:hypothetical protein [Rhizobium sp. Leaf383]|nr:hypothetical protein [Rhizobium sp. Leaf383]
MIVTDDHLALELGDTEDADGGVRAFIVLKMENGIGSMDVDFGTGDDRQG